MPVARSAERKEFLQDIFHAAIECGPGAWFYVEEYKWNDTPDGEFYALVEDREDGTSHRIDINTIAKGIGVISKAVVNKEITGPFGGDLVDSKTQEILYLSSSSRKCIIEASRENDAGMIDAYLALAIVECALFGAVTYA